MRSSYLVLVILLLSSVLLLTDHSTAQSVYGQVWGRLTSASGTPVSGAAVNMISVGTGARTGAKSNPDGYFAVSNVSADLYQIEVQADGFKRVQGTIVVSANSTTAVNVPLQAGDPNMIGKSTATGTSVLQLDRTDVSTLFDSRAIAELPLLNRNFTRLQLLVPGATRGRLFIPPAQNPQQGQPVNINGQHFSGSAFQFDGTENRDPLEGIVVINPTLDSVQEMKVTTQGYNAEFGQATAGVVTIQTRSGSNTWHGDAFGYRRTGWGESTDPFAPDGVPPSKRSIFGGSLGGPMIRNKLFIFGDYEGTRFREGANLLLNVPTPTVMQTCLGTAGAPGSLCDLRDYSNFIKGTLTDANGNPFPNNEIPNGQVSDPAVAILNLLPPQNYTSPNPICGDPTVCDNYLASGQDAFNGDQFDVRTDYNVNSALRIFGRYGFGDFRENGMPAFGAVAGGFGTDPSGFAGVARTRNQGISAGFTYSLSSRLLTDVRFGYFRYRLNLDSQDFGQTPDIKIPNIFGNETGDPFATGMPDIQIPGSNGLTSRIGSDYLRLGYSNIANNCNCPLREREQQFQFVNNWTRSAGRHIFKWGGDLRFLQNYRLASDQPRTGFFSFDSGITGLGLATFLIGDVTTFQRTFSTPAAVNAGERQKRFGFYGQDVWRLNSRLTLNYGLRWEIYFPQSVTGAGSGGFLIPNFNSHDPGSTFFNVATGNDANGGIAMNLKTLAPRLGIAYLLNSSTVIRAGYGRSFDAGYAGSLFGIAATQNPPVSVTQNVQTGGFNLKDGPPPFNFPTGPNFSLLDLAEVNLGDPNHNPPKPPSGAILYALPSRVRVPTVDSWNLTVQHELASGLYLELAYLGNKGTHVFPDGNGTYYDMRQPSLQNSIAKIVNGDISSCRKQAIFPSKADPLYCFVRPEFRSFYQEISINQPPPCSKAAPCVLFNPTLFPVRYFGNNSSDNYNALQGKLQKNFSHGYSLMAHYTWSKGLDYDSNYFRVDPRVGYGPSRFDLTQSFVMTNIWHLPMGRGRAWFGAIGPAADRFVGGWSLTAITFWRSGLPFTPSYKDCLLDVDSTSPCRPNQVGPVAVGGSREQYFLTTDGNELSGAPGFCSLDAKGNPTKFCGVDPTNGNPVPGPPIGPWQRPAIGHIGTAGFDSLRGPRFFQSDIGVAKTVTMTERASLGFRADVFNVFNKVNLGNPNPCVDCANGGLISALAPGGFQRTFQFSVRIQF